jgi:phosphatidylserine decarboxylase
VLRRSVFGAFARAAGIDLTDLAHPLDTFPTLDAFFTRPLKPHARTWPGDPSVAGSPVDGLLGRLGVIKDGELLQAKGRAYSAARLLGDAAEAAHFDSGAFLTIYLSPRHYHRIHAPTGDAVVAARHVPGALLPVNDAAVRHIPELFPRNERLVALLQGPLGRVAVVAIGAYNVGRISAAFDADWGGAARRGGVTNRPDAKHATTRGYAPPIAVERGSELMTFHLGSTVVLLFQRGITLEPLAAGAEIRLGIPIAKASNQSAPQ